MDSSIIEWIHFVHRVDVDHAYSIHGVNLYRYGVDLLCCKVKVPA